MGRKSRVLFWRRKRIQARASRQKRAIKKGPWDCPWCHEHTLVAKIKGSGRLILFACPSCKQGEMLPRHPTFQVIDLYNMLVDVSLGKRPPTFTFPRLSKKDLKFLQRQVTFGNIQVHEVIE